MFRSFIYSLVLISFVSLYGCQTSEEMSLEEENAKKIEEIINACLNESLSICIIHAKDETSNNVVMALESRAAKEKGPFAAALNTAAAVIRLKLHEKKYLSSQGNLPEKMYRLLTPKPDTTIVKYLVDAYKGLNEDDYFEANLYISEAVNRFDPFTRFAFYQELAAQESMSKKPFIMPDPDPLNLGDTPLVASIQKVWCEMVLPAANIHLTSRARDLKKVNSSIVLYKIKEVPEILFNTPCNGDTYDLIAKLVEILDTEQREREARAHSLGKLWPIPYIEQTSAVHIFYEKAQKKDGLRPIAQHESILSSFMKANLSCQARAALADTYLKDAQTYETPFSEDFGVLATKWAHETSTQCPYTLGFSNAFQAAAVSTTSNAGVIFLAKRFQILDEAYKNVLLKEDKNFKEAELLRIVIKSRISSLFKVSKAQFNELEALRKQLKKTPKLISRVISPETASCYHITFGRYQISRTKNKKDKIWLKWKGTAKRCPIFPSRLQFYIFWD